jgi:hypothetical protein
MRAHQLIGGASYGPDQLGVLFEAFDQAWEAIAADIGDDRSAIETTRIKLANLILSLARDGNLDRPEPLKDAALQLLSASSGR